MSSLMTCLN